MHSLNQQWGDEWEAASPGERWAEADFPAEPELEPKPEPASEPTPVAAGPADASARDDPPPALPPLSFADSESNSFEASDEPAADFRQEPAAAPQAPPSQIAHHRIGRWPTALAASLAFALAISLAYDRHERNRAQTLTRDLISQQQATSAALNQARSQIEALTAKMNLLNTPLPVQPVEVPAAVPRAARRAATVARPPLVLEDRRLEQLQDQVARQQKEIETAQQNLERARTDLANNLSSTRDDLDVSMARSHDELAALEKKGKRNYYEFDLTKSRQFKRVGSISLSLRKVNTRHDYFDLVMVVDDFKLERKHVNLYEPVLVYPSDSRQPIELVANRIDKEGIHGYVSEPRYREPGLGAGSTGTTATPAAGPPPSGSRANAKVQVSGDPAAAGKTGLLLSRRPEPNN